MAPKECERIYNEAYRAVYWTAISLLKNEADAEDVVQDTFVTLLESYDTLQDKMKVVSWLKKICANKCLNRLSRTRTEAVEQEFFDDAEYVPEDFLPESIVESAERRKIIMDIIEKSLSEDVRRTIILFYFDEMSTKEIAEAMGIPQGTVLWRLGFARKKIKKEVEKYEKETDTKLYSVALPFLALLFMKEADLVPLRPMPSSLVELSASKEPAQTGAGKGNVSTKMVTETIKKGTGIAMKKIIISCICIALLGAVTGGAVLLMNRDDEEPRKSRKSTGSVEQQEKEEDGPGESDKEEKQYKQMIRTGYSYDNGIPERGGQTVYDYDANGNVIRVEHFDKNGVTTYCNEYKYDENGRKIWEYTKHYSGRDDDELTTYDYELDEAGRVIKQTTYDGEGNIKRWIERTYDASGREIVTKTYGSNGKVYHWEEKEYDELGWQNKFILKDVDENGNPFVYSVERYEIERKDGWNRITNYDEAGTITFRSECFSDSDGNMMNDKQYHYSEGNLIDWLDDYYDAAGNKTEEKCYIVQDGTRSKEKEMDYVLDGESLKVVLSKWTKYEYDENGNLFRELSLKIDGQISYCTEYEYKY